MTLTPPTLTPQQKTILRMVIDYSALAAWAVAYFITKDFQKATWVLVIFSAVALALSWLMERRLAPLPLIYGGAALVFGSLTLIFHDSRFFKMKTTFIDVTLGTVMLVGYFMGKSPIKIFMVPRTTISIAQTTEQLKPALNMTEAGWQKLTLRFGVFFICMAALNELVWRTQPEKLWVLFRMPGMLIISFLFSFTQIPMMMKEAKALEAASNIIDTQA